MNCILVLVEIFMSHGYNVVLRKLASDIALDMPRARHGTTLPCCVPEQNVAGAGKLAEVSPSKL